MMISHIFPETARVRDNGHLFLGGCDAVDLVDRFGTPLYVFDEATLRSQCAQFVGEFTLRHADTQVVYACKAFINRPLAQILHEEGLGLDVVSGGELAIARAAAFPVEKVYFHGNNKTPEELRFALDAGIGRFVVDNFLELERLEALAGEAGKKQDILLRLSPGVDPHTHQHTTTGIIDSKFGFTIATGQAETAVARAMSASHLNLVGLHVHLGSPIFETEPYQLAMRMTFQFAAQMREKLGLRMAEFSPGGGFAIQYTGDSPAPPVGAYAEAIVSALHEGSRAAGMPAPRLIVEPGRSIVGRAGVALYTVGATKEIPGVRKYVSVDGGMADNIRPAIYGSRYEAVLANRTGGVGELVTIAGKFCESGDVLVRDVQLPELRTGDILAIPAAGAYCLSMASNYNASLKPPIVLVKDGNARLIRRRETYEDLMRCDVIDGR
ncbi:MAG: diaminopimelate decarboxylase [Chloroflexi bacterium]|nr:diaminopimelate decarboxylase [Chloroflexota bacterium]